MLKRLFHTSPKTALAAGLATALLAGMGVIAASTDTFTFNGNIAESGDAVLQGAAIADVQVALTELDAAGCIFLDNYVDGPLTGTFSVDIDMAAVTPLPGGGHSALVHEQYLCIKNAGDGDGTLLLQAVLLASKDVQCSAGEAEAGDATCGANGTGELQDILTIDFATGVPIEDPSPCGDAPVGGNPRFGDPPQNTGIEIPAGAVCKFQAVMFVDDQGDEDAWARAQTDSFSFSVLASLEIP